MNFERTLKPRTVVPIKRILCSSDLPPFEAGLTTALRRAFAVPLTANADEFDDLIAQLA